MRDQRVGVSVVAFRSNLEQLCSTVVAALDQSDVSILRLHVNGDSSGQLALEVGRRLPPEAGLRVKATTSAENRGFCIVHNEILAELFADGLEGVLVLNPDLVLDTGAIGFLRAEAMARNGRCLTGPLLFLADPQSGNTDGTIDSAGIRWDPFGRHFDIQHGESPAGACAVGTEPRVVDALTGACLYVPKEAWQGIRGVCAEFFDREFFAYREDAELGFRAALLGVDSVLVPRAVGRHVRQRRGVQRHRDPWTDRLVVRNRFLIAFKYGRRRPGRGVLPWVRDAIVIGGVGLSEPRSWRGIVQAVRLRPVMRRKGRVVLAAARPRNL